MNFASRELKMPEDFFRNLRVHSLFIRSAIEFQGRVVLVNSLLAGGLDDFGLFGRTMVLDIFLSYFSICFVKYELWELKGY